MDNSNQMYCELPARRAGWQPALLQCPRCAGRLSAWNGLSEEEREVVRRLPASAEYSLEERQASHRWCTRCWYETTGGGALA